MKYFSEVIVTLKDGVMDPQGSVVETILKRMNIDDKSKVTAGKYFTITVNADSVVQAEEKIKLVCDEVLSNPVLESYKITRLNQL